MPSDQKKLREQKKKDAARQKHLNAKKAEEEAANETTNDTTNGKVLNGNSTPDDSSLTYEEKLVQRLENELKLAAEARSSTGTLGIHPPSRDIKIDNGAITFHGAEVLTDTNVESNCGRRYGFISANGCDKSTLLATLDDKELSVEEQIDIYYRKNDNDIVEATKHMISDVTDMKEKYMEQTETLMEDAVRNKVSLHFIVYFRFRY